MSPKAPEDGASSVRKQRHATARSLVRNRRQCDSKRHVAGTYHGGMPSGSEWFIMASLAIYALALYGAFCLIRAARNRRQADRDRSVQSSGSTPVAAPVPD
jgi:hypothetical protein